MNAVKDFLKYKENKKKISIVTCYDYWSALIISESNIDALLVGDSAAMVMNGYSSTIYAHTQMMLHHTNSVKKGAPNKLIISDLPFLEHRKGKKKLFSSVDKLMKAGANAIKIEGADGNLELITCLTSAGVPVIGHLGFTPQHIFLKGGYKVQGKTKIEADLLLQNAQKLQEAGCFALVLEMVPVKAAKTISANLSIPIIGIGAGKYTDGQVLVLHDLLGFYNDINPKFVRKYLDGSSLIKNALNKFHQDVESGDFPSSDESFL